MRTLVPLIAISSLLLGILDCHPDRCGVGAVRILPPCSCSGLGGVLAGLKDTEVLSTTSMNATRWRDSSVGRP